MALSVLSAPSVLSVYPDEESLSRAAAELFVQAARGASKAGAPFSVALSGGHTPRRTYELLARPPFREQVDWDLVHIFWGDERCVPPDDPRSNARMAREALLEHVPVPRSGIHPILCHESPEAAAWRYEALLRSFFSDRSPRFDLIFLGLGENGHTASLFPGTPVLREHTRWVSEVYVTEQDMYRVTLTAPFINQARLVAFMVAGADKARILTEVLEGPRDPYRLPAQFIDPESGTLHWLVDEAAAVLRAERKTDGGCALANGVRR